MSKRVFIIHGWDGYPGEGWFPWLKQELEYLGFEVFVPQMPKAEEPRINNWIPAVARAVGQVDLDTYFVGHSMGCQAIARYAASLPSGSVAGGAVFVAGFFTSLTGMGDDAVTKDVEREWLTSPLSPDDVKSHINKSVAIFSDNDPFVPLSNRDYFSNELGSKVIIEKGKHHFSGSEGVMEMPVVVQSILDISAH